MRPIYLSESICRAARHCRSCRAGNYGSFTCPFGITAETLPALDGPTLWKELHEKAKELPPAEFLKWMELEWEPRIPGAEEGCDCHNQWRKIRQEFPFDPKDPYTWTVTTHNAVNRHLGKREWWPIEV